MVGATLFPNVDVVDLSVIATIAKSNPVCCFGVTAGQEAKNEVDFLARTLAVRIVASGEAGEHETISPAVTFCLPVPGILVRVELHRVLGPQESPRHPVGRM